jgi:uncharacterized SAM-binding protein YcdF (DUF218 family)
MRFWLRIAGVVTVLGVAAWLAGFVWFIQLTRRQVDPPPAHVDGIVALTGGAGRVELALHLLAEGQADKLLVSGIGATTDLATLGRLAGVDTAALAQRITLGRYAASTRGNSVEAAAWAAQNRIRTLIVVTAAFHMPRAMAELRQALPRLRLFALPVSPTLPGSGDHSGGEGRPSLRLQAEEYMKYVLAEAGVTAWLPQREPPLPAHPSLSTEG